MAEFSDTFDPSGAPIEVAGPKPTQPLPGGLKAICIIAIVLGGAGIMAALWSGVALLVGEQMQAAFSPPGLDTAPELKEAQDKMQAELGAINRKFIIPLSAEMLLHLFTAALLLVGSIMTLQRKVAGPGVLIFGCAGAILYLLGAGILQIVIQLQALPIYKELGDAIMSEGARGGGPDMPNVMMIGLIIGLVFAAAIALAKIIFYLISIFYLRRSKIRALFQPQAAGMTTFDRSGEGF